MRVRLMKLVQVLNYTPVPDVMQLTSTLRVRRRRTRRRRRGVNAIQLLRRWVWTHNKLVGSHDWNTVASNYSLAPSNLSAKCWASPTMVMVGFHDPLRGHNPAPVMYTLSTPRGL